MMRRLILALPVAFCASQASAEKFNSILADDAKTVAYTPCSGEETAECISHVIHCRGDDGFGDGLAMTILGGNSDSSPDVRKLGKALIDRPFGEAAVSFTLGGKTVDLNVNAVTVSLDEMNGDWDLALHFMDDGGFFDALSKTSAKDVRADVAGAMIPLSSTAADGANLLKFKTACGR